MPYGALAEFERSAILRDDGHMHGSHYIAEEVS